MIIASFLVLGLAFIWIGFLVIGMFTYIKSGEEFNSDVWQVAWLLLAIAFFLRFFANAS